MPDTPPKDSSAQRLSQPSHNSEHTLLAKPVDSSRIVRIILLLIVALGIPAIFIGRRGGDLDHEAHLRHHHDEALQFDTVHPATAWQDLHQANLGPNAGWQTHLGTAQTDSSIMPLPTEEERQQARQRRRNNRAYDGAPPTIPHRINGMKVAACTACHAQGLHIGSEVSAPAIPHTQLSNCTQCHIPQQSHAPEQLPWQTPPEALNNLFAGLNIAQGGQRAYPSAPPTQPHSSLMRENCMSCHGSYGRNAIRTSHPWRQNCNQCHTPSANADQFPSGAPVEGFFLEPNSNYHP